MPLRLQDLYPQQVRVRVTLSVTSVALFNQIRAVDQVRLIMRFVIDDETLERVDEAIKISLGLIRL